VRKIHRSLDQNMNHMIFIFQYRIYSIDYQLDRLKQLIIKTILL